MSASDPVTSRLYADTLAAHIKQHTRFVRRFHNAAPSGEILADLLTCIASMATAFWLELVFVVREPVQFSIRELAAIAIGVSVMTVLLLHQDGAYRDGGSSLLQIRETERALRASVQSVLVMFPVTLLLNLKFSTGELVIALALVPLMMVAEKHAFAVSARGLRKRGSNKGRAAVYGVGGAAKRVVSGLSYSYRLGLHPVVVIDDDQEPTPQIGYERRRSVPVRGGPVTSALLKTYQCGALIVALPNLSTSRVTAAVQAANQAGVQVTLLSGSELGGQQWTKAIDVDGFSLASPPESHESRYYDATKRLLDLIGSALLLVVFAPLLLLIAVLVKLDSPGPATFSQERVGRKGELFRMYKFRSMHLTAPQYDLSPITQRDPRITRIGRLLRRTSLDELPQLINVLLGQMSLVGPRPEMPFITHGYTLEQRQRLQVIPGITGLWQLSADRAFPIHENIQYDLYYIRNRTFFMDIAILIRTLFFALRGGI